MGKVKGMLEEDMKRNPELYDGSMDYEHWYHNKNTKKKPTKRRSNVRKKRNKI